MKRFKVYLDNGKTPIYTGPEASYAWALAQAQGWVHQIHRIEWIGVVKK